jgi:transposase
MEVIHTRCAGLDVHKDSVVACVRLAEGRKVERHLRQFSTTTRELYGLLEWLQSHEVTHVGMEATGVYWKPVWHVLEGQMELILGNAKEIRNVPGRKSDVNDATWLADLLAHGLIRASFVPRAEIQELRDLTRTRKQLTRERSQHVQRIQKVLEDANVKLASVVSDILGVSGRSILEAMITGVSDPRRLAKLGDGRLHATAAQLEEALLGRVTDHHRFMLQLHLRQIDALDRSIDQLERRVEELLVPFADLVERLQTIPGVKGITAAVVLAEVGDDVSSFPSAGHLVSWGCLSPSLNESAGKRRSTRTRKAQWLKATLVQAAWSAARQKNTYLNAQFHRIRARRGGKKAVLAVAASMLTAAYHVIKDGTHYHDLGPDYFHRYDQRKAAHRLVQRLNHMGYRVQLQPVAA